MKLKVIIFVVLTMGVSVASAQEDEKSGSFWGGLDALLDKVDETSAQVNQLSERVNTSAKTIKQTNQTINDTKKNVKDATSGEGVDVIE